MKTSFTEGALFALTSVLSAESLAAKKAAVYAKSLTDISLASRMQAISQHHYARFLRVLSMISGEGAADVQGK